jgi:hypothetical protein
MGGIKIIISFIVLQTEYKEEWFVLNGGSI